MNISQRQEPIYAYIGQRIRERRKLLKLSQTELADLMGFSYQQMQKYETGASHVSAGKLLMFARILNVPPNYFYEGLKLDEAMGDRIDANVIQKTRAKAFRVLLVEDNPADVILFKKAMNECEDSVEVHTLHDADSTMDFLQNHETKFNQPLPDIIMLDLSLPRAGGLEMLKSIKKHPGLLGLPVVILTNSISMSDMLEAYKHGAAGFIQKSVDLSEYMGSMATVVKYWSKVVALPA
jgi:CheY-like chemotaxis protein/DNA-binding XRE family transcriptional regulator